MTYTNLNGYLVPNLTVSDPTIQLGRYGNQRRQYLVENHPSLFDRMTLEGTLYRYLKRAQEEISRQVDETIQQLLAKDPAPDKQTDPMGWTAHMNSLKAQAEELAKPLINSV